MVQDTKNRKIRVHAHFRKRTYDDTFCPEIKLQGNYLEQAGFEIGGFVDVTFENDCIIIRKGVRNG